MLKNLCQINQKPLQIYDLLGNFSDGDVGMALSQSNFLTTTLSITLRFFIEVGLLMTSVDRLIDYENLPKEYQCHTNIHHSSDWPNQGEIKFKNVSMRYGIELPLVLKVI